MMPPKFLTRVLKEGALKPFCFFDDEPAKFSVNNLKRVPKERAKSLPAGELREMFDGPAPNGAGGVKEGESLGFMKTLF
eukprot:UN4848